ncbi:alpha/beta-hydrolase [Bimuria novae-zelandiae CBS 107.79]|uniref:Alpha/beta-hydrolase n=1 Tax=Bimuria novae-zelandiae CBS 107.79 TaxID=1447943 RepID=A0A6A5V1P5_9PLEO|nr:alpha/beta-hydrolase [Bimuria novae-zelandiae CBS 107.79]
MFFGFILEHSATMSSLDYVKYALIRTMVNTSLYIRRSSYQSPGTQPNLTKIYQCRTNLFPCRIFLPKNHSLKASRLPLVIRVHGGGFVINNPAADDLIARHLADSAHCIVVSIDYSKSPQNNFPIAYEDVIAQSLAVIENAELPIDRERVVLCGSSAGGNLLLSAAQDQRLQSKVTGIATLYPIVTESQMATRRWLHDQTHRSLTSLATATLVLCSCILIPKTSPLLPTPTYFQSRESLPPNILLIGAEHDMFCHEDEQMADKLAGDAVKSGSEDGWRALGVQWYKVFGRPHAFHVFPVKDPEKEKERLEAVKKMYGVLVEWLCDVFSKENGRWSPVADGGE